MRQSPKNASIKKQKKIFIDQYGQIFRCNTRKELMETIGSKHCDKMYVDTSDGQSKHVGYVIKSHWLRFYQEGEL
jgi:hypothetical protein